MKPMEMFGAYAYTDNSSDPRWKLSQVPDEYAIRIDMDYPDGRKVVLIYETAPAEQEQADLMWKVQQAAGQHNFTVTRTDWGKAPIVAPPIG